MPAIDVFLHAFLCALRLLCVVNLGRTQEEKTTTQRIGERRETNGSVPTTDKFP